MAEPQSGSSASAPPNDRRPTVRMLGTRGIPAAYGGFETAAENVALHLVEHGWRVIVYCQTRGTGPITVEHWRGIELVHVPVRRDDWISTADFDLRSIAHAVRYRDLCLTFGYNTAILNIAQRVRGIRNVINMDGIEWSRARWGRVRRSILWINERIGGRIGDALIADHPEIARYLSNLVDPARIHTIAYGAPTIAAAPDGPVRDLGLEPGRYLTLICRPILENSILELVRGFSARPRGCRLLVLGSYRRDDPYHRAVLDAASDEVVFPGVIYDAPALASVRFHSLGYLHGHTVGGTNPSLVEALGAGNAVIAHDNLYNRWVAGDGALYFRDADEADDRISRLIGDHSLRARLAAASRRRHEQEFTWERIAGRYRELLTRQLAESRTSKADGD